MRLQGSSFGILESAVVLGKARISSMLALSLLLKHESNNEYDEDMDKNGLISVLSSQLLTIIERDDGNKKKQRMEKEAMLPSV